MESSEDEEIINEFTKKSRILIDSCNIDTNSRTYWEKVFKAMDDYSAIPFHKRENVLYETLNDPALVYRVKNIYDVYEHDDIIDLNELIKSDIELQKSVGPEPALTFVDYDESEYFPYSTIKFRPSGMSKSGYVLPPVQPVPERRRTIDYRKELTKERDPTYREGDSMYTTFLNRPPELAMRWRPKPPLTLEGMTLDAKCDAITREIARDFVEWMETLGGETKTTLNASTVEGLFEIGFNCHAADSLKVNIRELNAITEYVAYARNTPELSFSTQLYRQLFRDKTASKNKENNFAFGTMIPPDMRHGPTDDCDVAKWLENKRVPDKLATMAVVWEDIERLKSTEGYCNWLLQHENIPAPSYLVSKGMLEKKDKNKSMSGTVDSSTIDLKNRKSSRQTIKTGLDIMELKKQPSTLQLLQKEHSKLVERSEELINSLNKSLLRRPSIRNISQSKESRIMIDTNKTDFQSHISL